ncbi:hypothetical protein LU11_gp303 [Pseudomonas phage Lu11]|uniref:hypothetical protein n=1 Tax=Pseudomonas phage Lu11 TaxID=1161927 RepID=UPI00025F1859|nr:hypothetical protein LU11_gp303 [Pseudomonas phage Lu11]AFH14834.1 hypothetical protein Lu11_0296 [Pseudomonas phage Lu11]
MEIKVKISTTEIEKRIFDAAADVQSSVVRNSLNVFFNAGCAFGKQWGGVEGAGHLLIREAVEQKLNELWDSGAYVKNLDAQIEKAARQHFDKAIERFADFKGRKIAWQQFNEWCKEQEKA